MYEYNSIVEVKIYESDCTVCHSHQWDGRLRDTLTEQPEAIQPAADIRLVYVELLVSWIFANLLLMIFKLMVLYCKISMLVQ